MAAEEALQFKGDWKEAHRYQKDIGTRRAAA
jgi:hypothetical protein